MNRRQKKVATRPTPTQIYHRIYKDVDYQTNPYVVKKNKKCSDHRTKSVTFCHHKSEASESRCERRGSQKPTKPRSISFGKPKTWNGVVTGPAKGCKMECDNTSINVNSPKNLITGQKNSSQQENSTSGQTTISSKQNQFAVDLRQDKNKPGRDLKFVNEFASVKDDNTESNVSATSRARKAWEKDTTDDESEDANSDKEKEDNEDDDNEIDQHDKIPHDGVIDEESFHISKDMSDSNQNESADKNANLKITNVNWKPIDEELEELQIEDVESNSDDYDTDIEESFPEEPPKPFDPTGEQTYGEQCKKYEIIPVRRFISQLPEQDLKLRFRGIGQNSSKAISEALLHNYRVQRLDLSHNNLGFAGGSILIEILRENAFLTKLDLSENQLGADVGCQLAEMLLSNTGITKLYLRGNKFTDRVAKMFAETLKTNATLRHLDLSYNEFNEQGALFLGAGLALNKGVANLNLRWNCIRAKGGVSLAAALSKNSTLKELDLSWNGLTFIGCLALGRHLKKNRSLEVLDISNNRIGQDGPIKLSGAISHHPCLRIFKIGWNPLGDVGVQKILKAAEKNPFIEYLGFEKITITQATQAMIDQLQVTRKITIVTGGLGGLSKGKLPPGNMDRLVQHVQDNRMRLTDIFFQIDKDRNDRITKEEFVKGLAQSGLKMDKVQISHLIDQLDTNNDGDIEFSEILFGQRTIMSERRFQKKVEVQTEKREAASIRLPKIKGF